MRTTMGRIHSVCVVSLAIELALMGSSAVAQGPIAQPILKGSHAVEPQVVASNLVAPHYLPHANDGSGRLFVVDHAGDIALIKNGIQQSTPYFSVSSLLPPLGLFGTRDPFTDYDDRGLLSGNLIAADDGQSNIKEINIVRSGDIDAGCRSVR